MWPISVVPSVGTLPAVPRQCRNMYKYFIQNVSIGFKVKCILNLDFVAKTFDVGKPTILKEAMYCCCGFSANSGNKMAKHLGKLNSNHVVYFQFVFCRNSWM